MRQFLKEARVRPIITGLLKRSRLIRKLLPVSTGGTNNSRYCYSVWLRHIVHMHDHYPGFSLDRVAELGPGDSLGIGIAALLSGAKQYIALDVIHFWNAEQNLKMMDDLLDLFSRRESIPQESEFPRISPKLRDNTFPGHIISEQKLIKSLNSERIQRIRKELAEPNNPENTIIRYFIPWYAAGVIEKNSVDLIFSQAVLEHVDDLVNTYSAMKTWLKPNGLMSHAIDFKSHGFTRHWNGHWTLSESEWKILRGGRVYAINREPYSRHIEFMNSNGFEILFQKPVLLPNQLNVKRLDRKFRYLNNDDLTTSGVYVIGRKRSDL